MRGKTNKMVRELFSAGNRWRAQLLPTGELVRLRYGESKVIKAT
jgi:hypothetical protein